MVGRGAGSGGINAKEKQEKERMDMDNSVVIAITLINFLKRKINKHLKESIYFRFHHTCLSHNISLLAVPSFNLIFKIFKLGNLNLYLFTYLFLYPVTFNNL